jgi:hypothetical protein
MDRNTPAHVNSKMEYQHNARIQGPQNSNNHMYIPLQASFGNIRGIKVLTLTFLQTQNLYLNLSF